MCLNLNPHIHCCIAMRQKKDSIFLVNSPIKREYTPIGCNEKIRYQVKFNNLRYVPTIASVGDAS